MMRLTPRWLRQAARFLLAATAAGFTGCSTTGPGKIVQISPDTYSISLTNRTGLWSEEMPNLKAQAIGQSMDFAASQGKVAVPATLNGDSFYAIAEWNSVEYRFKLVDKDDPRAKQTSIASGRDDVVEREKAKEKTKDDVYAELKKLDELRKKGILTEAEFQSEKQKLLNRPK